MVYLCLSVIVPLMVECTLFNDVFFESVAFTGTAVLGDTGYLEF